MAMNPAAILSLMSDHAVIMETLQGQVTEKGRENEALTSENEQLKAKVVELESALTLAGIKLDDPATGGPTI